MQPITSQSNRESLQTQWPKSNKPSFTYLIDSRAHKLAAKNNMTEQDGEVSSWLRVLGLLVQHEPSHGHQVSTVSISFMIHFFLSLFFLSSPRPKPTLKNQNLTNRRRSKKNESHPKQYKTGEELALFFGLDNGGWYSTRGLICNPMEVSEDTWRAWDGLRSRWFKLR